jgi:hypothetical protein
MMHAECCESVEAEIDQLQTLDLDALKLRWRAQFGRTAPVLSKQLLLRLLAYRLQAQAFGDLSPATRRLLDDLARKNGRGEGAVPVMSQGKLMAGTVLVREHEGKPHHVMVTDDSFVWNGKTFPSLSKVAHAITGTKWNGPRFFGLRDKASPS